jgi:hypothetical protein
MVKEEFGKLMICNLKSHIPLKLYSSNMVGVRGVMCVYIMSPPVLPFQESEVEGFEESTKKQRKRRGKIWKIDVMRMRAQVSAACLPLAPSSSRTQC